MKALAQRLQTEEITAHYGGNRTRNHQIRTVDLPTAREQQMQEADQAEMSALADELEEVVIQLEAKCSEVDEWKSNFESLQVRQKIQYIQNSAFIFRTN